MQKESRYIVNGPNIVHENFDGEMVVVNLETGCYYAFNTTGSAVWGGIEQGCDPATICAGLREGFCGEMNNLEQSVATFLQELADEGLIRGAAPDGTVPFPAAAGGAKPDFAPPGLEKFTDMQDLLLLDPIHEVDETGWPHPMSGNPHE